MAMIFLMITLLPAVPIVVGLLAPIITYLIAARRFSGKIETSEAKDLWAESRSIRDWSQHRMAELVDRVTYLEKRVAALDARNRELMDENFRLLQETYRLRTNKG